MLLLHHGFVCAWLGYLQMLTQAELDILVFADQMSELGAYLYSMGRFAAVQVSADIR